jgi:hypothetical protein
MKTFNIADRGIHLENVAMLIRSAKEQCSYLQHKFLCLWNKCLTENSSRDKY